MKNVNKKLSMFFFCVLLLLAAGCQKKPLYQNLSQADANKVVVLLQQNGIEATLASVTKQNTTVWNVSVEEKKIGRARELIVNSNIISPRSPGLKEVYQPEGSSGAWIKTPAEERARSLLALKGEVINALKALPEVVEADVVLNIPEKPKLGSREKKTPTASVVIKARKPEVGESALDEMSIQQWVANTVDDLAARDVAVLINFVESVGVVSSANGGRHFPNITKNGTQTTPEAEQEKPGVRLMGLKLDKESRKRLKVYLIIFFAVLVLISVALIVTLMQSSRTRQELKALKSGGGHPALEGEVVGSEPPRIGPGEGEEEGE